MITGKPLLTVETIQKRVRELGKVISDDYKGLDLCAVGILKGAFMFYSDLIRNIGIPLSVDFITAHSYVKSESTGDVKIDFEMTGQVKDRHILLVEDIVDSGLTLNHLRKHILKMNPASLKICVFLDKKECRKVDIPVDYTGFTIEDSFVVGYGLDYDGKFRNLPYISEFKNINQEAN